MQAMPNPVERIRSESISLFTYSGYDWSIEITENEGFDRIDGIRGIDGIWDFEKFRDHDYSDDDP